MGRLIDADILIAELKESALHHCNNARDDSLLQRDRVIVRAQPTVEAIPKAEYENRLKADMVAILDKIRAEIAEYGSIWVEYKITGRKDKDIEQLVTDVLKQAKKQVLDVIDKYKAESEDNRTVTIDKSINQIIDSLMGEKAYLLDHSDRVALTNAVNTMRKYQKIKEIVRFGNANELGFEYVGEKITEVIEDDNSNLDNSSMRSDQSNTEHRSDSDTGKE